MPEVRFTLHITAAELLRYYRGETGLVEVTAHDGRRIRFSAINLRPFVTLEGVHGRFVLRYDENQRLVSLERG